jgi:hypothetical protein
MSTMSQLSLAKETERCANCGTKERPAPTVVIGWRIDLLCDECVARFDWSDWQFDPVLNVYWRAS